MSKQVILNGFMISSILGTPTPTRKLEESRGLTAVIVKLNPVSHGRCCLCNHRTKLPFCLEYFSDEGRLVKWGEICQSCAGIQQSEKKRG